MPRRTATLGETDVYPLQISDTDVRPCNDGDCHRASERDCHNRPGFARARTRTSPLIVRVASFPAEQGTLGDYRSWIDDHLFPTLRKVPGYRGTFLGRNPEGGQLVSLSFWESGAAAVEGEEAVGRVLRSLPMGTAPRPSKVEKYIVEYRDIP